MKKRDRLWYNVGYSYVDISEANKFYIVTDGTDRPSRLMVGFRSGGENLKLDSGTEEYCWSRLKAIITALGMRVVVGGGV